MENIVWKEAKVQNEHLTCQQQPRATTSTTIPAAAAQVVAATKCGCKNPLPLISKSTRTTSG